MNELLPVKRSKSQARRNYDRISAIYDWLTASEIRFIKQGVALLAASPGERILEIGCGTGTALALMADALSGTGTLIGVDLSGQMLLNSKEKLIDYQQLVYLIQGDGTHLPIQNHHLDGLFCSFTLELFAVEEIQWVLNEIQRVLKPSGRLVVVSLAQNPRTLSVRLYELAHRLFPVVIDCRPIPLNHLLAENGFDILTTTRSMNWGLPVQITLSKPRQNPSI